MTFTPKFPTFLHGGDYNPDQWLDRPDILDRDVEMMQKAHVNAVSVGVFSWARLETDDGVYDFEWLDQVIDRLWKGGIHVILATPSGARPAWMAQKYPEVLRVNEQYQRYHFGGRHNHCFTAPVYRRKVHEMDTRLAERYAHHPAVILWHLSNEFSGHCYCEHCQEAFRGWLKKRYGTLENLNQAWWTSFWAHRYTDWSQVEAPGPMAETSRRWNDYMTLAKDIDPFLHDWLMALERLPLSARERIFCIFYMVYPQFSLIEIAKHINYAEKSIRTYKARIAAKLSCTSADLREYLANI